ncbi:hypothetical protein [Thermobacillus composti]|uniref:hypothetical protein n=1 Tax=Thermobacillus composti TaxID=377615 RepID=UPI0002D493FF|nr:hypothetical protein [Thermobacillus composti]
MNRRLLVVRMSSFSAGGDAIATFKPDSRTVHVGTGASRDGGRMGGRQGGREAVVTRSP